jgi:hypothetical protein
LLALVPRRTGGDGLVLVKVTPELIVHLHRQSRICMSSTVTGAPDACNLALVVRGDDPRPAALMHVIARPSPAASSVRGVAVVRLSSAIESDLGTGMTLVPCDLHVNLGG